MQILILIVIVIVVLLLVYAIGSIADPKAKEKYYHKQIKVAKTVIDENEDALKNISTKGADIASQGVEITARAIKKGFSEEKNTDFKFCKRCGKTIDSDSIFCNYCGKEQ